MRLKEKNIALVFGFFILLFISYKLSIQKTFESKELVKTLRKEKELLSNAGSRIYLLQQENKYLDSILNKKNLSVENSFQQTLLQKINSFSKKKEIVSFYEPHSFLSKATSLTSYSFEIKGDFNSLIQLVNYIERQQLGHLVSVNFEKKKNYRKNKNELMCQIFIQKWNQ